MLEFFALIGTKRFRRVEEDYWINEDGLWVGKELVYARGEIAQFAIKDHGEKKIVPWADLVFITKGQRPRMRKMMLPHEDGVEVREYLIGQWKIPEFDYQLGASEIFRRIFGL